MRTIYRNNDYTMPLYRDPARGTGSAQFITEYEAFAKCEKGGAVIVDEGGMSYPGDDEQMAFVDEPEGEGFIN